MAHVDLAWLGCDLVTGSILAELPDLIPSGRLGAILGDAASAQFTLPLAGSPSAGQPPDNWEAATEKGRTMVVAVVDGNPLWAGIVLDRRGGSAAGLTLGCVTLEGYLSRRFVANHTWVQQDEVNVIARGLVNDANTTEGIGLTLDMPATGTLRDRTYLATDDKTVRTALQELMGVLDGPEWTILPEWQDANQTTVRKRFLARKRIGSAADPTFGPVAWLETTGVSEATYELVESYADGDGSNHVIATSSGEGDLRPQSAPARDAALFAAGWPRYEYRYTPSTSISNTSTLNAHAQAALKLMNRGADAITLSARAFVTPMVGADFGLGDDIGLNLVGPRHPQGYATIARVVAWELDPAEETIHPVVILPGEAPLPEGTVTVEA